MWSNDSCCQLWGNGENYLPFVLVEDVASALVGCLDKSNLEGESYNLVSMPCLTGQEYLRNLKMAAGVHIDSYPTSISKFYSIDMMKWVVKMLVRHHDRKMPSYRDWKSRTQLSCFNSNKARQELDWQPSDSKIDLVQRGIQLPVMELYGRTSTFTSTKRLSLESTEV